MGYKVRIEVYYSIVMYVIALTILLCLQDVRGILVPSKTEGRYRIESYQTVSLKVGTPPRTIKLVLDFTSHKLLTRTPLSTFSSSLETTLAGMSDVVHIQGKKFRVLVATDTYGSRATALGCLSCQGVLGVGPSSKLWLYGRDATFTAGAIAIEEGLPTYERIRSAKHLGRFACLPLYENICTALGTVEGTPNMTIIMGTNSPKTLVPVDIFDNYVNGLSTTNNPNIEDWGDIDFVFPKVPGSKGKDNHWSLKAQCIVTQSRKGKLDLLLDGSGDPNIVVLSKAAMDCMMLKRFFFEGTGQVVQWTVHRRASLYNLVALIIMSLLYSYWTLDPAGAWTFENKPIHWKTLADGLTIVLSIVSVFVPSTWNALWAQPEVGAYVLFTVILLIMWQLLGSIVFVFRGKDMFGEFPVEHIGPAYQTSQENTKHLGQNIGNGANRPLFVHAHFQSVLLGIAHPRLWVVQCLSRQSIVALTIFLLVIDTRVDSFGSLGPATAALLLIYGILYYGLVGLVLRGARNGITFVWALFWMFYIYLIISTVIIMDMFVLKPFLVRFTSVTVEFTLLLRVGLYAFIAIISIIVAIRRVKIEEILREQTISNISCKFT